MINDIQPPQITFCAKPKLKKSLPKIETAIQKTLSGVESPNKTTKSGFEPATPYVKDLNNKLGFIRAFLKQILNDEGLTGYFRGQIGLVKQFRVAHCDEYAEITKTALKANGINNCDVFILAAKNKDGKVHLIDHAVTAIGVKKSHNNKDNTVPFTPRKGIRIIDSYYDGYIGTAQGAKKKYSSLGLLQKDETLMLCPIRTYEPDKTALNAVRKEFPTLIVNP